MNKLLSFILTCFHLLNNVFQLLLSLIVFSQIGGRVTQVLLAEV